MDYDSEWIFETMKFHAVMNYQSMTFIYKIDIDIN